jgi:DNA-binding IclR family transcriptional regulator
MNQDLDGNKRDTGGVQVIARAAAIMRALAGAPEGLSLAGIAQQVELPRSTVQRIVAALEAESFVAAASPTGRVRLGSGLARLAAATRGDLQREVRPFLDALSREANETVDLAILEGDHVVFVDQVIAPRRLRAVSAPGVRFPLHCTANGKAVLAELPMEQVVQLVPEQLEPFTSHTITTRERLLEELEEVRATGIAYDREEHTEGICAVGANIHGPLGELAAITIPLPATRFYGHEEHLASLLLQACFRVGQRTRTATSTALGS